MAGLSGARCMGERGEPCRCESCRLAIEEFWIALEESMPDSEVFRKNERGKQKIPTPTTARKKKIVVDEKAAKRHKSELMLKNDLMFSG